MDLAVYVNRNGESWGPYSWEELCGHYQSGAFLPTDLAWHEGLPEWKTLGEILAPQSVGSAPVNTGLLQTHESSFPAKSQSPNVKPIANKSNRFNMARLKAAGAVVGVLLLLVSASWWIFADEKFELEAIYRQNGLVYDRENGELLNGIAIGSYTSGDRSAEIEFKEGQEHGLYRLWHKNGQILHEAEYREGERHGFARWYDSNGRLANEAVYLNGKESRLTVHFDFEIPFDAIPQIKEEHFAKE